MKKKNQEEEEEEEHKAWRRRKKNKKHEEEEAEQEECSLFEPLSSHLHGGFLSSITNLEADLIGCLSLLLLFYVFVGFDGRKP
jgi:hypothetical protein